MNKPLTFNQGKALQYATASLHPQFNRIARGDDNLFNRIPWFDVKGNKPYPLKFSGMDDDQAFQICNPTIKISSL